MDDLFYFVKNIDSSTLPFYDGEEVEEEYFYIGNKTNKSYHLPKCTYAPKNHTKRIEFSSIDEAKKMGFRPCSTCNPR